MNVEELEAKIVFLTHENARLREHIKRLEQLVLELMEHAPR